MSKTDIVPVSKTAQISFADRGVKPVNVDDLYRYAMLVHQSGLAPSGLDSPQKIVIAIETGVELGLPLQASVRSVYVVRGTPSLRGDAALALVMNSGLLEAIDERIEGAGDDRRAVCAAKRRGGMTRKDGFSIADAKRAGLLPAKADAAWTKYPDRMLRYRALGVVLRDLFPDVLLGVHLTEEVEGGEIRAVPVAEKAPPAAPDPVLAAIVAGSGSPGSSGSESDPATDHTQAESGSQGGSQDVEEAADETLGGGLFERSAAAAEQASRIGENFIRAETGCGLCGAVDEYEINVSDTTIKDVPVKCKHCGAEFPFANPYFAGGHE